MALHAQVLSGAIDLPEGMEEPRFPKLDRAPCPPRMFDTLRTNTQAAITRWRVKTMKEAESEDDEYIITASSMRFEARELEPYSQPVKPEMLREEGVYFSVTYADEDMLIPVMDTLVFIGRNLDPGDVGLGC